MSSAPSRPAGAAWYGRRSARRPAGCQRQRSRYGAIWGADRRLLGLNNIELITDRPLQINLQEMKMVKKNWPDRALIRLDHGALRRGKLEGDPAAGRGNRRRWHRAELRLSPRHVRTRHGGRRRTGAGIYRNGRALVQAVFPHARHHQAHPNITDIRKPARAAKAGGTDAVSLINTINSIVSVDLDNFAPNPTVGGKGTHGGYCGPAVKPIALNMVAEIARDPETYGLPISGIGGVTTWRDAAEFLVLGAGNVQVCTAAMTYGFKIVQEMITGLNDWMDAKGHRTLDDITGRAVPKCADWQYLNLNYIAKARIDQDACIKCGRCHIACEDTSHQAITSIVDGVRKFEVMEDECVGCNLCVNVCPVEKLHHHGRA